MTKYLLPLAAFALIGCFGDDKDCEDTDGVCETGMTDDTDSGDPMVYDLEIDVVSYGYDATEWMYEVELIGWAENVSMYITQDTSSPWEEDHDLVQGDFDPHGAWDQWAITLPITAVWSDQESGVNTLFSGDAAMESTMAWRIDAYEAGAVVDCVVWGSDISLVDTGDCREITF